MSFLDVLQNLTSAKKTVQACRDELTKVQRGIAETLRAQDLVRNAPAHLDDIKAYLRRWAAEQDGAYAADLAASLKPLLTRPLLLKDDAPRQQNPFSATGVSAGYGTDAAVAPVQVDRVLFALFREQAVLALERKLDQMDWSQQGLPLDQRPAAIATLETRLRDLYRQQAELVRQFEEAGFPVPD